MAGSGAVVNRAVSNPGRHYFRRLAEPPGARIARLRHVVANPRLEGFGDGCGRTSHRRAVGASVGLFRMFTLPLTRLPAPSPRKDGEKFDLSLRGFANPQRCKKGARTAASRASPRPDGEKVPAGG